MRSALQDGRMKGGDRKREFDRHHQHRIQERMPTFGVIHDEVEQDQHRTGADIGQQDLGRVDERGVAQDTRIGMERPEGYYLHCHHNEILHTG